MRWRIEKYEIKKEKKEDRKEKKEKEKTNNVASDIETPTPPLAEHIILDQREKDVSAGGPHLQMK